VILVKNHSPEYRIPQGGSESRPNIVSRDRLLSPGPGTYDLKPKFPVGDLSYTMGQKRPSNADNGVPSPSQYQPEVKITKEHNPEWSFPKGSKNGSPNAREDQNPGPGQYEKGELIGGTDSLKYTIGERIRSADNK
jgi:Sperm-tail PG-rich repeat